MEAATQPSDGCAAGVGNCRMLGALRPGCPRGRSAGCPLASANVSRIPRRSQRSGARPLDRLTQREGACPTGDTHRESEAQSLRSDPWAAVRRAGLDPMQPVPDSGTGTLQVSRHETLEKPETDSIIPRAGEGREGFGGGLRPAEPKSLAPFVPALCCDLAIA